MSPGKRPEEREQMISLRKLRSSIKPIKRKDDQTMFDKIGEKINILAKFSFFIEMVSVIIGAIICFYMGDEMIAIGFAVLIGGSLAAYIGAIMLCGFGKLVENSDLLTEQIREEKAKKRFKEERAKERQISKEINNYRINAQNNLMDERIDDSEYIDFYCPECREKIAYTKAFLKENQNLECPLCGSAFRSQF